MKLIFTVFNRQKSHPYEPNSQVNTANQVIRQHPNLAISSNYNQSRILLGSIFEPLKQTGSCSSCGNSK